MVLCFESVLDEHIWMQKIKYVVLKDLIPKTGKGYDLGDFLYIFKTRIKFGIHV